MDLKKFFLLVLTCTFTFNSTQKQVVQAYPIFAQQNYKNPREANGRIVCANCHLAQKPVEVEVPQAVLPDTVFKTIVHIPEDKNILVVGPVPGKKYQDIIFPILAPDPESN